MKSKEINWDNIGENMAIESINKYQINFTGDSWWHRLKQLFRFIFIGKATFNLK